MFEPLRTALTAPVRLVIWDLDETFWNGTLSDGGATPIDDHVDIVRGLVDRGIMCSICSRSDHERARARLEEMGVWDLFVFPHIDPSCDGQTIAGLIEASGLRPEDVLFIDDNALTLRQALEANDGLMVWECTGPMTGLLDLPEFRGVDDPSHSRLARFRAREAGRTAAVPRRSASASLEESGEPSPDRHVVVLGGSELRQIASSCGTRRTEFVNRLDEDGMAVRYDDVGFFLNPRDDRMRNVWQQKAFVGSTVDEMRGFDEAVSEADVIVLSMYRSIPADLLFTFGGPEFGGTYWGGVPSARLRALLSDPQTAIRFVKSMHHRRLPLEHRLSLARRALAHADSLRRLDSSLFVLGAVSRVGERARNSFEVRGAYNDMARSFCETRPGAHFIEVDRLVAAEDILDSDRFSRRGLGRIAEFINRTVTETGAEEREPSAIAV